MPRRTAFTVPSAQQGPEVFIQEPVFGVELEARLFEARQPAAKRLFDDRSAQTEGLIEQRAPVAVAAELIVGLEELLPTGIAGGDRVYRHHWTVKRIRKQSLLVLGD